MRILHLSLLAAATVILSGCNFLQKPKHSGIQVITNNVPSAVFLNDQHINNTPLHEKTIAPGQYTLKLVPENPELAPYETTVTLREGLLTVVTWKPAERPELSGGVIYEMEPLDNRTRSEVSFVTIPDGAIISFQSRERTFSPIILTDVAVGQHEFELTLPSYETQKHTINVIPGFRMVIRAKLAKNAPTGDAAGTSELDGAEEEGGGTATSAASASQSAVASGSARALSAGGGEQLPIVPAPQSASASAQASNIDVTSDKVATSSATATKIRVGKTGFFLNGAEALRVRDAAGATGKELGFLTVGETAPYLKETKSGWHKISFKREVGWVSSDFTQLLE
jgi:hypothetical protein